MLNEFCFLLLMKIANEKITLNNLSRSIENDDKKKKKKKSNISKDHGKTIICIFLLLTSLNLSEIPRTKQILKIQDLELFDSKYSIKIQTGQAKN